MRRCFVLATLCAACILLPACVVHAAPSDFIPGIIAAHSFPPAGTLEDRVGTAPQAVLDYFAEFDKNQIPEDKPYRAHTPTTAERAEIASVIGKLPDAFRKAMTPCLAGIYFIDNMIGSGWTEWFIGPDRREYYIIALNSEVLSLNASQWLTKKEKSAFVADDPAYDIRIDIGTDVSGFYYVFFHEAAHVFDYIGDITPGEPGMESAKRYAKIMALGLRTDTGYPFPATCWKAFSEPRTKYDFPGRMAVTFYGLNGGPYLKISAALSLYEFLEKSPFATLYGAQNWMEDFAEMFAVVMSVDELHRPWKLTVTKNGKSIYEIDNPLKRHSVAPRVTLMKKLISNN